MAASRGETPIRVLWLAKGLGPGGMEKLLETHARVGDRDRFELFAAYLTERPHSLVPSLEALGVPVRRLGDGREIDVRWARQLRRLVRDEHIDVVHSHSPFPAAVARVALRGGLGHVAHVYTEHNSWDCYGMATRVANAVTYPLDDHQLAVSEAAARSAVGPLGRRVEVLTHGIDTEAVAAHADRRDAVRAELGLPDGAVLVVTVANLRTEKAYDVLLAAARRVIDATDDVWFVSVGQGPLADELEAERQRLGLGDRFRFLGFRDDVADLLAAADICCFASRHEGLPVAMMEATALGLPVVGTRVGGLPDAVADGVNGRIVDPENPAALADALVEVAGDPERRAAMAAASKAGSSRFDARAAVARIEDVYRSVVR